MSLCDGYIISHDSTCDSDLDLTLTSGSHATPFDCKTLCESMVTCRAFVFRRSESSCKIYAQCRALEAMEGSDVYNVFGKTINIVLIRNEVLFKISINHIIVILISYWQRLTICSFNALVYYINVLNGAQH